jgi:CheY-like chemotaxis protein
LPTTIEMRQALDPATPLVLANANQIHQVIMNLGTNAYHAMRDTGGVLELRTDPVEVDPQFALAHPPLAPGAHARLSVRDTGHGMDGAVMQRLFEPFYTTKPVGEGTGLGLAVVHGIVASHQGAIVVESAPGQGTTFEVYLPPAAVPAEAAGMPSENTLGGRERLLVVDDDPAVARLVQRTLQGLGYHVTVRTDSVEALATFREGPGAFDLVITDHTMPQLTGIGLTAELRRTRPDVRVLMTTGAREAFTAEQRGAFGVLDCLMKPFSVDELAHAVRRALDARGPGARGGAADERAAGT